MNRRRSVLPMFAAVSLFAASGVAGQQRTIEPDLTTLAERRQLQVFNRSVSGLTDGPPVSARS